MANEQKTFFIEGTKIPMMITDYNLTFAAMHWHKYWEILVQKKGRTEITVGSERFTSTEGDITIIGPNQLHETKCLSESHNILLLQFETSILTPVMDLDNSQKYIPLFINSGYQVKTRMEKGKDTEAVRDSMERLLELQKRKKDGYEFEMYSQILHILYTLISQKYLEILSLENEQKNALLSVHPSILYIDENYDQKISQKEMAEMCYLSPTHFSRLFKKATGSNMVDYINGIRLKEASRLLKVSKLSISEISALTGFSSVNYFNKVFKGYYGLSPREYKRKIV